jgi:hypothetical protein
MTSDPHRIIAAYSADLNPGLVTLSINFDLAGRKKVCNGSAKGTRLG